MLASRRSRTHGGRCSGGGCSSARKRRESSGEGEREGEERAAQRRHGTCARDGSVAKSPAWSSASVSQERRRRSDSASSAIKVLTSATTDKEAQIHALVVRVTIHDADSTREVLNNEVVPQASGAPGF